MLVSHWRVTKNVLCRAPPCFGRHVKPLVPAAFAVVSTHQSALPPRGGIWAVLLMCSPYVIHKEGLYPSSEVINRLMTMMIKPVSLGKSGDCLCSTLYNTTSRAMSQCRRTWGSSDASECVAATPELLLEPPLQY
jgi:hypothetical protein